MTTAPWTIERICEALGSPTLSKWFLGEINTAPAHLLVTVFAKWQRVAEDTLAAVERGRELAQYDERGEDLPGEWIDGSARLREAAERGAA